ncbi:Uncharacterised protein [Mycobacteroides abscessus subsp. abscessus]|nr:Uncharacterised protein [Mycobacteroides abscessus subsp. abscessus]
MPPISKMSFTSSVARISFRSGCTSTATTSASRTGKYPAIRSENTGPANAPH